MPSPLAHSVSGYVLGKFLPLDKLSNHRGKKWDVQIFYPVIVAAAADLDFIPQLITGNIYHRGLTHSLTFTIIFSAIVGLILSYLWKFSFKQLFLFTLILYSSHLLLDVFTKGGNGLQLFLPFSDRYFKSPVAIFPGVHHSRGLWDYSHIIPLTFELIYSALLLWVVSWRKTSLIEGRGAGSIIMTKKEGGKEE
ncbi:MAG: metal-dependent hydrolase [Symploca sp. SIO2C1]|nr:metal-dependent hydrolase [Symploca sp. SIO2C1]